MSHIHITTESESTHTNGLSRLQSRALFLAPADAIVTSTIRQQCLVAGAAAAVARGEVRHLLGSGAWQRKCVYVWSTLIKVYSTPFFALDYFVSH